MRLPISPPLCPPPPPDEDEAVRRGEEYYLKFVSGLSFDQKLLILNDADAPIPYVRVCLAFTSF